MQAFDKNSDKFVITNSKSDYGDRNDDDNNAGADW